MAGYDHFVLAGGNTLTPTVEKKSIKCGSWSLVDGIDFIKARKGEKNERAKRKRLFL